MAGRKKETYAPTRDLVSQAKDWTVLATLVIVTATIIGGMFRYSKPVFDSGPMPFPARAEVEAVDGKIQALAKDTVERAQNLASQLAQQAAIQKDLMEAQKAAAAKARAELAESLNNRLRNLQATIDQQKAEVEKDPSPNKQKVLETLQAQIPLIQRQIMDTAGAAGP